MLNRRTNALRVIGTGKEAYMSTGNNTNGNLDFSKEAAGKRTYTVSEIAHILQIGKSKAYELSREGLFRTIKIGRAVRISKASFDEWFNKQI